MYARSTLTEPPLRDLFGRQGKYREQFSHYLDNDICHNWCGRHCRIDLETFQEIRQALEKIEQGIVTGGNATGSLAYV